MNKLPRLALCAAGLTLTLSGSAWAELKAVDPGPYTFATGKFPMWYQDKNDLSMELCQSRATSSRVPGATNYMCTLLPEPGVYDDALPLVFPDNWPPEMFWFLAETTIPNNAAGLGMDAYVAGIEAAFASENPVDGDQQSFARIRIRVNVPVAGRYIITHPYGVETVDVTTPGRRAINITKDIGIGAPGNFTGAVGGAIGPFLRSVNGPYTEVNPDTGAVETYVGDPNLTEAVTGSPNNTNFVRITGPNGLAVQTNLFTLSGKVLDARTQTQADFRRATYRRTSAGTRVEAFAHATAGSGLCLRETIALVPGNPPTPCQYNLLSDNNGLYFSEHLIQGAPPPVVVLTASHPTGVTRPTSVSSKLTDVVKISTARYDFANKRLTIQASSTDEVVVPDLVAQGYGRLSKNGTLQSLTVNDLTQPPASVTVKSAFGGSDTEPVQVIGGTPIGADNQAPVAQNDTGTTSFSAPLTLNVLANDSDPDNNMPLTIADLTQPATGQGTVALSGNTAVIYTPPAVVNAPLVATFTYRAQDSKGLKSAAPATVTVNVTPNQPPVAVGDSVAATAGTPLVINVLANDTDPENNLPLAVASVTQPARGTVAITGNQVTYTPPAVVLAPFATSFTYVARDSFGALSAAGTVNVQVGLPETFTVTASSVVARAGGRFTWDLSGTSSAVIGNTVTIQVTTPTGLVTLGSTLVPITGRWRLVVNNSTIVPTNPTTATIRTSLGTVRTVQIVPQ